MKNFDNADIITSVAYKKKRDHFLPRSEQIRLNAEMKNKMVRFVSEIADEKVRPLSMKLFDEMMNGMHGQRVIDLYNYRKAGNHVMTLLCNSIPPELVYGMGNFIPVSVCMGAGEVEPYSEEYIGEKCSLLRSMVGFLKTGMCVFFNLADYVLASDLCPDVATVAQIIPKVSEDFEVYCLKTSKKYGAVNVDVQALNTWVKSITGQSGFDREKLVQYASLFSDIRKEYKEILSLRRYPNPPLDGRNSLWIQQLMLVEDPEKLLKGLKKLRSELEENLRNNIGYNSDGRKKRVMLITPRIMPPFGEIFRLIEKCNAILVCEEMDMGVTNINYDFDRFNSLITNQDIPIEEALQYMLESVDNNSSSCVNDFDIQGIVDKIQEYKVDAVIAYSFTNCPVMHQKTKKICKLLNEQGFAALNLQSDYMEIYDEGDLFVRKISNFLTI
ncbi:2-hydroxyacyl-CoA dehydratase [Thermophagus sp. OGC60D27]|uniref:2-hydroxyacyl-CoA dehydratase n=1 Tax=Thermophagus sp. OGC60D27 TaxID=3458415 RepID=UPI0040382913